MKAQIIIKLVAASLLGGIGLFLLLAMPLDTLPLGDWLFVFAIMKCAALACLFGAQTILRLRALW